MTRLIGPVQAPIVYRKGKSWLAYSATWSSLPMKLAFISEWRAGNLLDYQLAYRHTWVESNIQDAEVNQFECNGSLEAGMNGRRREVDKEPTTSE